MSERIDGPYSPIALPSLPLEDWKDTKETLYRYAQIVGKIGLEYSPFRNHWWHVPLYVTTRGLTTSPIPYRDVTFEIFFDPMENRLVISTSEDEGFAFAMDDLPVACLVHRRSGYVAYLLAPPKQQRLKAAPPVRP